MRARRVEIERVVVDAGALSSGDSDRFRVVLAEELARLLNTEGNGLRSRDHVRVDAVRSTVPDERSDARVIAESVALALTDS